MNSEFSKHEKKKPAYRVSNCLPAFDHLDLATNLARFPVITAFEISVIFIRSIPCGGSYHFRQFIGYLVEVILLCRVESSSRIDTQIHTPKIFPFATPGCEGL